MAKEQKKLAKKFIVVGSTGSGKTTLSEKLSDRLGLRFIELDALYWLPDWNHVPVEVFQERVKQAISQDNWVVAGNYHFSREILWPVADAVIWLDYSLWTIFWRLWNRTWRRWWHKELLWGTNRERLWPHLKLWSVQDSLFAWLFSTYQRRKKEYTDLIAQPENSHLEVFHFFTPLEAETWLDVYCKKTVPCSKPLPINARLGVELFNAGEYYRAHEELENAWRDEKGEIRVMYQALLQIAVVFLHIGIDNYLGAVQLGEKAKKKFVTWNGICQGIDLNKVRDQFTAILTEVERLGPENLKTFDKNLFFKIEIVD